LKGIGLEESCPTVAGELFYIVRARCGEIVEACKEPNMIMTPGRVAVARLFSGAAGGNGKFIGVGEDDMPPSPDQTELLNQCLVEAHKIGFVRPEVDNGITIWVDSESPTPNVRFDFIFGTGDANGMSIKEFGLFTSDGVMFARRVRSSGRAIEKDEDLTIEGYWIIRF
jgi:hypothetical protein